ncbi:MAG: hypothetical protein KKC75_04050, partial [Nanoarchaeota archaeon]|nr:hypothetical protein [Nanoarchaeota archaeon]MBU1946363.1 hypothetical protein [Nanoarchaeota archaeon]
MRNKDIATKSEEFDVEERLEYFREIKERIGKDLAEIRESYQNGLISGREYKLYLKQEIEGKTREEWIGYCDKSIFDLMFEQKDEGEKLDEIRKIKERIEKDLAEIRGSYQNGLISGREYKLYLKQEIEGKTREEWKEYCDKSIAKSESLAVEQKDSVDRLDEIKELRERIEEDISDIKNSLENGVISKEEYYVFLNQKIDGKTRDEWKSYCDEFIAKSEIVRLADGDERERLILLNNKLKETKSIKNKIEADSNAIKKDFENGVISEEEYYGLLSKKIEGKTRDGWKEHCDKFIETSSEKLKGKRLMLVDYKPIAAVLLIAMLFGIGFMSSYTGYVTISKDFAYEQNVSLMLNSDYNYTFYSRGSLKSIRLDGTLSKNGHAKAYLERNGSLYLIFDSDRLSSSGVGSVTGLAISDENVEEVSDGKNILINGLESGRKGFEDVFKFDVESEFGWNVDSSKLCTKWDINNVMVCYGADDCCALIGLGSSGEWNSSLYLSYGRYDSGDKNLVKSQVIYADYSLDIENIYSDIVYSNVEEAVAEFYEEMISFNDICIDTCLLHGFNESSFKLVFVVEDGNLTVDSIRYSVEEDINVSKNMPSLIKEIGNITLYKNDDMIIDLNEYFEDKDGDKLNYSVYDVENINLSIRGSGFRILPEHNFTGKRYMFVTADDGYYNVSSNLFTVEVIEKPLSASEVNVTESLVKPQVVINRPVRWIKVVNVSANVVNLSVNISSDALNVSVRDMSDGTWVSEDKVKVNDNGIIKDSNVFRAEKRVEQIEKVEDKLAGKKAEIVRNEPTAISHVGAINKQLMDLKNEKNKLTGYAVASSDKGFLTMFFEWLFNADITGYAVADINEMNESSNVSVVIEEIVNNVEIEYYTEAPVSEEENLSNGKKIIISSDTHYEDILAYTYLDDAPLSSIKLYNIINNSKIETGFNSFDTNGNGLIDYIEWIVPHLSNETYEVEITVLNVQSYPTVRKNWVVRFNTSGTGNLTISASNGTSYSEMYLDNESTANSLELLELKCNESILFNKYNNYSSDGVYFVLENNSLAGLDALYNKSLTIRSIKIINYSCNSEAYHTVKVLTPGAHTQEFNFSGQMAYANNFASSNCSGGGDLTTTCYINETYYVFDEEAISANNL